MYSTVHGRRTVQVDVCPHTRARSRATLPPEAMAAADSDALMIAKAMSGFDDAINMVEQLCGDPTSAGFLRRRKHELQRSVRGCDPDLQAVLAHERKAQEKTRLAMQKKFWVEDRERDSKRAEKKDKDEEKKKQEEASRAKKKRLRELELGTDRTWTPQDFGTQLAFTGEHRRNIREAMDRLKLRAPPLPDELQAVWHRFREDYPMRLRGEFGQKLGVVLLTNLSVVLIDLGQYALQNPALKSKKPRAVSGGDPKAFENFLRHQLKLKPGSSSVVL